MTYVRLFCVALLSAAAVFTISIPTAERAVAASSSTGCLPGKLRHRLNQIKKKFGRVRVISTHRPGARIAGSGRRSFHASCRAVDFHPPRGKYRAVVAWLKANHGGGVGTYSCGMHHIHIDNGPRIRFHHCVNAKGKPRSRYASRRKSRRYTARKRTRRTQTARRRTPAKATTSRSSTRTADAAPKRLESKRYMRRLTQNGA